MVRDFGPLNDRIVKDCYDICRVDQIWQSHSLHRKVQNTTTSKLLEWGVQTLDRPGVEQVTLSSEMFLRSAKESMTVFFKVKAKKHLYPSCESFSRLQGEET